MKKLIWASLDDYLPPGDGFQYVGRNIANYSFFQAFLKYGHFEEYHFFLANSAHRRLFKVRHADFLEETGSAHKVKLFDRMALPDQTKQCDYTVFHQSDHVTLFNSLCRFRNQTGSFPVTAFIHSLSYQHFMSKYLEMAMGGVTSKDALICSSQSGKTVLQNCFRQITEGLNVDLPAVQMEVIPLGFDGSRITDHDPLLGKRQLGLDEREVIGLCFGRFSDYDKMDLFPLLQAFQSIYASTRPYRLILAGGVHSESYVKILTLWAQALGIADKVTIMTNISEKDKVALYRSADFFVSLSDNPQETFGLTLLEAMASGLPLVVSDFDGYREIVTDDIGRRIKTTWSNFEPLVNLGPLMDEPTYHRYLAQSLCVDVSQLADVLNLFFSSRELRKKMGKKAQNRFLQLYDYRLVISKLEEYWLRLKADFCHDPERSRSDPLAMNVFECFSHYPTKKLTPDTKIERTPYALSLLESGMKYPLLPEMDNLIDQESMKEIIKQMTNSCSISDLTGDHYEEAWKKRYLLLWMLKHGLLQVTGESNGQNEGKDRERISIRQMSARKPRLLYVLHNYFNRAGTEQHTKTLTEGLKNQYDIKIVFPHQNQICVIDSNEKITSFPSDPPAWPITPYTSPQTEHSLSLILNSFDPDIVHIQHFIYWPLSVIDHLINTGKPVVMSFHDYYPITPQFTMQGVNDAQETLSSNYARTIFGSDITTYLRGRREIISRSLKNLRALITPSPFLAQELNKIFSLDFQVIEHGISPFEPLPNVNRSTGLRFGYVGSLLPQKGWNLLAQAFAPVRKKFPSAELYFYGGGQQVISNRQDGINFYGVYEQEDLPRIFSEIDIGFIPSVFRETYSLVLSEMWLAGLPVAVSDIGALGERIINGKNGKKFPPGDIEEMTKTLIWFLENDEWSSWSTPKPRLVDEMIKDYDKLYRSLITT